MLTNYINDEYLESFYSDLAIFTAGTEIDFSVKIDRAFQILMNDLQARAVNPRKLMVGVDLNRPKSPATALAKITVETTAADWKGVAWQVGAHRRFVVNVSAKTVPGDSWDVRLQGSNLTTEPTADDTSWETYATLSWPADAAASEKTVVTSKMFIWARVVVVKVSGTGQITFTAQLQETVFDDLICYKTLELIAAGWNSGLSPMWELRLERAVADYKSGLNAVVATYDEDDDGVATNDAPVNTSAEFYR